DLPHLVNWNHIRMLDRRGGASLENEALSHFLRVADVCADQLESNFARKLYLRRLEDLAHSTRANRIAEDVPRDFNALSELDHRVSVGVYSSPRTISASIPASSRRSRMAFRTHVRS